jgi:Tetratricopeptide repeat
MIFTCCLDAREVAGLGRLEDGAMQVISIGEWLLADRERLLGPDHPGHPGLRNNLTGTYQAAGRTTEAITLFEQAPAGSGDPGFST